MKPGFENWLAARYRPRVAASRSSNCQRVECYYGDLGRAYDNDRFLRIFGEFAYSTEDRRHGRPNPCRIPIEGDVYTGLATLRHALGLYLRFLDDPRAPPPDTPAPPTQAPMVDGRDILRDATASLGINLTRLVARSAIWAPPPVFLERQKLHPNAAWFPQYRRGRKGEARGAVINGERIDDNTMANQAIKLAVFGSSKRCTRLNVCHVWPKTCYDVRYHTGLANLVLLPAALAGLSDHDPTVGTCLRYRAYELFGWHPEEEPAPEMPPGYPHPDDWFSLCPNRKLDWDWTFSR